MQIITRQEAKEKGLKRYYTGKPCKYGHDEQRRVRNNRCLECHRQDSRKRYKDPVKRKQILAKNAEWVEQNPNKVRKIKNEWVRRNKENVKASQEAYRKANPDKIKQYRKERNSRPEVVVMNRCNTVARRAGLNKATPAWVNKKEIQKIYKRSASLTKRTGTAYEVDHIIPLQRDDICGLHVPWNLQVIPAAENRHKSNKLITQ